jgi:hypothetical protein
MSDGKRIFDAEHGGGEEGDGEVDQSVVPTVVPIQSKTEKNT